MIKLPERLTMIIKESKLQPKTKLFPFLIVEAKKNFFVVRLSFQVVEK